MSKKPVDDGLAADAALAVEHTPEREAEQLSWYGGDKDDIDDFDPAGLDDGSDPDFIAPDDDDDGGDDKDDKDEKDDVEDEADDNEDDSDSPDAADKDGDEGDADAEDEDTEDADEADPDDDSEDEDDPDPKPAPKGIPKHRFDEVNERRKAAEEENTRLKAQIEAGKDPEEEDEPYDIRANEKEYMDLLLDGDTDGALAKREEIDAAKEAKWRSDAKTETKTELSSDAADQELIALSREAESMFDVFNPEHEDFNQGMLNKVLTFMKGYEAEGNITRGDAFVAGLADAVELYDLMPEEEGEGEDDPKPKPTGKKKVDKKKAALKKKTHQPVGGDGAASADVGAAVPNIDDMTDEEFDALPEKTQARLRGDFI